MKKSSRDGFILVEVLIGLLLTALLFQALLPLLSTAFLSWRTSISRMQTHQTARMAMEAMTRELRFASAIASPLPEQSAQGVRFTKVDAAGKAESLVFQKGAPSGNNAQTLYRIHYPGQPTPVTQNVVSELQFEYRAPRLIVVTMTVTDPQTKFTDSVQTSITCVNIPD